MSLFSKIKNYLRPPLDDITPVDEFYDDDFIADIPQSSGKVVRLKKRPEYTPYKHREGGMVVKAMPRKIRRIKEAQEAIND